MVKLFFDVYKCYVLFLYDKGILIVNINQTDNLYLCIDKIYDKLRSVIL